jgi:hypothetical protein
LVCGIHRSGHHCFIAFLHGKRKRFHSGGVLATSPLDTLARIHSWFGGGRVRAQVFGSQIAYIKNRVTYSFRKG